MKLSLLVLTPGKGEGKVIPITLPQFLIGRDPQCNLRPASPVISKRHCAVILRDSQAFLRDFDSTNGTFLNDQPVKGEVELKHDDRLKVGPLEFLVRLVPTAAAAPVDQPTPVPPLKAAAAAPAARPKTPLPPTKVPAKTGTAPAAAAKKPAPAGEPTPALDPEPTPAPAAAAKPSGGEASDDDIAAMLMELGDDGASSGAPTDSAVPEGSTMMEIPSPFLPDGTPAKPAEKDKEKPKPTHANTSSAAKAILDKYMKRPRG
jgi:pSer/pThr/pTyr-binding forkhead associated (FHA) protein